MDAAMATTTTRPTTHVVVFPFPAHGHLPGMLAVARLIRRSFPEVTITLVSTARNIAAIRDDESVASINISLHALPFVPANHGLPDGCETISSLPVAQFITLFEAFESLEPAFDALVSSLGGSAGVCIVADPIVAWTVDVARRHGCAHALTLGCSALGSAIMHALWRLMPALPFGPDGVLRLRVPEHGGEEVVLHRSQLSTIFLDPERAERWTAFQRRRIQYGYRTDAVLVNTVEEFEPRGLAMVRRTLGDDVSVYPVGPLVKDKGDGGHGHEAAADAVIGWLNTQRPASVLYICFGSQNSIRPKQMTELAGALELTGRPFLWAIRAPVGLKDVVDKVGDVSSWGLPEGFEERARAENRGLLVRGWAPQVRILAHASTGGFLSHCGWNSTLESLTHGVPMVGWPVSAEQFYNAKMLQEEWGVCVEAARGNLETSEVCRSKLAEDMESVMGDTDTAARMRRRALEVQEMLSKAWADDGGSSTTALHGFFTAMRLVIT